MEKKPVTKTLREMDVNQTVYFPIEQSVTIRNTIQCRLNGLRKSGWRWTTRTLRCKGIVTVTRLE